MTEADPPSINRTNLGGLQIVLGSVRDRGPKAVARSLADALRGAVRDGRLPASTALPASRSLAADLGVSRGVVVRVYEQLQAEGYLVAHTGRGTMVAEVHATDTVAPMADPVTPLSPGVPALRWFPRREWLRAVQTALADLSHGDLGYGDPRGHPRLRRALAAYLGRTRAVVAPVDRIVVTAGFAQAIRLVGEALAAHGLTRVGVENPGSVGVTAALRAAGVSPCPVPVDEHGLVVETLAEQSRGVQAVVVTPAHQFPTGAVLAPNRRTALLEWAGARQQGVVVEDDYDAEFRYDRSPVGALQGLAAEHVVYGGSVSKTLAPALRLGWVVAPAWLAGTVAERKFLSDIAAPVVDQVALAVLLESGVMDRHLRRMAARYATRRSRLLAAVSRYLPHWTVSGVAAGLHAVLLPPSGVDTNEVPDTGSLVVTPLASYAHDALPRPGLVVGYGAATPDQVEQGIAALAGHA